jgi:hypothetical protein
MQAEQVAQDVAIALPQADDQRFLVSRRRGSARHQLTWN